MKHLKNEALKPLENQQGHKKHRKSVERKAPEVDQQGFQAGVTHRHSPPSSSAFIMRLPGRLNDDLADKSDVIFNTQAQRPCEHVS